MRNAFPLGASQLLAVYIQRNSPQLAHCLRFLYAGGATGQRRPLLYSRTMCAPLMLPHVTHLQYPAPGTLHPTPGAQHLTPGTLHLTPYTSHPTPCTLHLAPDTLHLAPYTLHPTPCTLHPTPGTLHPAPHGLHPPLKSCCQHYKVRIVPDGLGVAIQR